MQWNISYLETVAEWLDELTKTQLKSVAKEIRLLEISGNKLKPPHSRALGDGLFELRERRHGLRIYYCFNKGRAIILLLGGNKSTQIKDIKKALSILKKYQG